MFSLSTFVLLASTFSPVLGQLKYVGMNIAGLEFGCDILGVCDTSIIHAPVATADGGADGAGQMEHFANDDLMNIFRIPVSWQYLVDNKIGPLNEDNFAVFDGLMQSCLGLDAYCVIDVHNYARWEGTIIGQGGPTDAEFADLWTQLATKYVNETRVVFGLMNEPHDILVPIWADTVQAAVTAIRKAGAETQWILLPGVNYASGEKFVSSGSAAALNGVTNPDKTTDGLYFDFHKYLDIDNSGTHVECVTDNVVEFAASVAFLTENKRMAIVSETGAANSTSCYKNFCAQNDFFYKNSDVFLGYIAWAAGSFSAADLLVLTPTLMEDGTWEDQVLAEECVIKPWMNSTGAAANRTRTKTTSSTTATATPTRITGGARTSQVITTSTIGATQATNVAQALKVGTGLLGGAALVLGAVL